MHDVATIRYAVERRARRLAPRRFHAYYIGAAKTGTTSLAKAFHRHFRAGHEPDVEATTRLVIDALEGRSSHDATIDALRERDKRLKLELESAHPLGYVATELAEAFPDARFVVTVREPMSWLRSRLNFHHKTHPPEWAEYRNYFWEQRHDGFAPQEAVLESFGLVSLDTYLRQYGDHYRRVLSAIESERRLVVRTDQIDDQLDTIATFVGANPNRVIRSRANSSPDKITPLDDIDPDFVCGRIIEHCGDLVDTYFPERSALYHS